MIALFSTVLLSTGVIFLYVRHPKFGKAPSGSRLERIQKSPNYKDGKFQNIHFTPTLTEGYSMNSVLYEHLFKDRALRKPKAHVPSIKTDLKNLSIESNLLVWFGHSSYFIQLNGKRFLIDPVFSGNASPVPGTNKSFEGSDIYTAEDMPIIDYLLITHDHYDHLDYETVMALKPKVQQIVCGLGVGGHFDSWDFDPDKIIEKDWHESVGLTQDITIHTSPARHFSGRSFTRNNTLWMSFVILTPELKLYIGGDSGYDTHFAQIGEKFGPFDLAILENGQYNLAWKAIHMLPEEGLKAAKDLKAKRLLPVHSSKFVLANHAWDEPLEKMSQLAKNEDFPLVTPKIGEIVYLDDPNQNFTHWWKDLNESN